MIEKDQMPTVEVEVEEEDKEDEVVAEEAPVEE